MARNSTYFYAFFVTRISQESSHATKKALGNVLPVVLGGLATMESAGPGKFEDWDGDDVFARYKKAEIVRATSAMPF